MVKDTPSRAALSLFVDGMAGKDENAGTKDQPVKSIPKALSLSQPGDEIVVRPGKYVKMLFLEAKVYGMPEKKLTIRSQEPQKAVLSGIDTKGADYLKIEGFEVVDEGVMVSGRANELRNLYIHDIPGKTGVDIKGENHLILGNHIQRVSYGVVVDGKNNRVEGNEIEQLVFTRGDCDYIRFFGDAHVIRGNYLHGTRPDDIGTAHVDGFQSFAENPGEYATNVIIEGNLLTDHFMHAVMIEGKANWEGRPFSAENITVRSNVFAPVRTAIMAEGIRRMQVYGNTFIMVSPKGWGVVVRDPLDGSMQSTAIVQNNIFYGGHPYGVVRPKSGRTTGPFIVSGKNLLFNCSRDGGSDWTKDITDVDPLLVNPADLLGSDWKAFTGDDGYLLKSDSPCIDAGVRLDDTTARDILGIPRPQGPGWDIGAHEVLHADKDLR
jgi:hypothetical protein